MKKKIVSLFVFLFAPLVSAQQQAPTLQQQILAADNQFFTAFNQCDIDTMATMFSQKLEFYHDQGGLSDYTQSMQNTRALCERNLGLQRTLLIDTVEIHPITNFGAIQTGQHQFCHEVEGKMDCGTFKFLHVWHLKGDTWQLHRVVSYDH
ncbi:nuclear transport factor 2 family protein [Thalassotalea agarivorans]|uniref:DUF4440 domain-containing protein n=1 Tax=Thalassotalea agarivorans TaxID=349064 RepID=A0A1H9ZF54_THASX|nr:nuclear transport factor 2 family protein [Thalassotalea agarivorans]SES80280.1 protein of unknown function [Thalassotalea agarivorans]